MTSRKKKARTLAMNTTLNQFRFTSLGGRSSFGNSAFSVGNGQESGNAGGQIGVDEMVWDGNSGTIATFQDSPSLISLLNSSREGFACSFVA
jgi:hypothetical protein